MRILKCNICEELFHDGLFVRLSGSKIPVTPCCESENWDEVEQTKSCGEREMTRERCSNCGTKYDQADNFCTKCATKLKKVCDCWVRKGPYDCGQEKCPGYGLFEIEKKGITLNGRAGKMKIPDEVKIGGFVYGVKLTDKLDAGRDFTGEISFTDLEIRIKNANASRMYQTLLHEIIHGIYDNLGFSEHDEQKVDMLAGALYGLIVDNPEMFKPFEPVGEFIDKVLDEKVITNNSKGG